MKRCSRYLEACTEPVSRNTVENSVRGKRDAVRDGLDRLIEEGYVEATPGPRNAQLLRSARPFREASDEAV
jgi:hypothetical protein